MLLQQENQKFKQAWSSIKPTCLCWRQKAVDGSRWGHVRLEHSPASPCYAVLLLVEESSARQLGYQGSADLASWRPTVWAHKLKLIHPPLHLAHQTVSSSKTTSAASLSVSLHLFNQVADVSCFFVFEGSSSLQFPKFLSYPQPHQGFPCGSAGKKNLPAMQETWVWSLGWEDPLEKGTATHSSYSGEFHGLYSPWGHNESDMTEQISHHFFISHPENCA